MTLGLPIIEVFPIIEVLFSRSFNPLENQVVARHVTPLTHHQR